MAAKSAKTVKAPQKAVVPVKASRAPKARKTTPAQPQAQETASTEQTQQQALINAPEGGQHVPGQVEIPAVTPELKAQQDEEAKRSIPAEGNNIAKVRDRAYADTPPANLQKPVEKTFVSSDNV